MSNMFLRALSVMSGEESSGTGENSIKFKLMKESGNIEILDYIVVRLCEQLDPDKMAFHGGYILNKILTEEKPRGTTDIDFSVQMDSYYIEVMKALKNIGEELVTSGVFSSYTVKDVATDKCSGGMDLYWDPSTKRRKLGVDVGVRDITHGLVPINISGCDTTRFTVERILADKISAIYSDVRYRRPKDLYDFFIITNCFDVDMKSIYDELKIEGKLDFSNTPRNQDTIIKYERSYDKLRIISQSGNDWISVNDTAVDFRKALGRVMMFEKHLGEDERWNHINKQFV